MHATLLNILPSLSRGNAFFDVLSDALKVLPQTQKYIRLANGRANVQVPLDGIVSVITNAHYLNITLMDGRELRPPMTMAEFMEKIGHDAKFIPINKGIVANAEHILSVEENCCIMAGGVKFPVRVRDSAKIEQAAQDYYF